MSPISDFTNEIYDQDSLNDAFKDGADVWTVFLGVVVTLLPKVSQSHSHLIKWTICENNLKLIIIIILWQIIPRVMPAIVPEQTLKERFDDENYVKDIENLFREKFLQNLGVSWHLNFHASASEHLDNSVFGIKGRRHS